MDEKVRKSSEEWRRQLTEMQYRVTREHGTEPPFTSPYNDSKEPGLYRCVSCDAPLFRSEEKFDSGTGWPSFWTTVSSEHVSEHEDRKWFMRRTEVRCARCDAHLGHVFDDGPQPTGLRYCINGVALRLDSESRPSDQ